MQQYFQFVINHWFLWLCFIIILLAILWVEFRPSVGGVLKIAPQTMVNLINHDHAVVVDVRDESSFNDGHVINAMHILPADLEKKAKKLQKYKNKPIILVCAQGITSLKAGSTLKKLGFEKLYSLNGGMGAWKSASLPIEQAK